MKAKRAFAAAMTFLVALAPPSTIFADPCGMVPPIWLGQGAPITRIGVQKTYAFYKNGVESIVIRPGFSGKADEFGMLIPFPNPPAIRKVADDVFPHIAAAVDPPEVLVDLRDNWFLGRGRCDMAAKSVAPESRLGFRREAEEVTVISREAVGMYEVAVLEAGSSEALKSWMDDHGFRYPEGMDATCDDYVEDGWCFVAIKARVGQHQATQPHPGMREVDASLPAGAIFDGHVQAMGFRFRTPEFVVPMRLSVFNAGELRNIVYVLNDQPVRIAKLAEDSVVRQIPGWQLFNNVTDPLPLRILGGGIGDIPEWRMQNLPTERNALPHNGIARELFAGDLLAARTDQLSHPHEEREKDLLEIGERLGLRGLELDALHHAELERQREQMIALAVADLRSMTLTVIDSDFPRELIAAENVTFVAYNMPQNQNRAEEYDARQQGPAPITGGFISNPPTMPGPGAALFVGIAMLAGLYAVSRSRRFVPKLSRVGAGFLVGLGATAVAISTEARSLDRLGPAPGNLDATALAQLRERESEQIESFVLLARRGGTMTTRGWAIIALSELGGRSAQDALNKMQNEDASPLIQLWASAALVSLASSPDELAVLTDRTQSQPALVRPVESRWRVFLADAVRPVTLDVILDPLSRSYPLQQALLPSLLERETREFVATMLSAESASARNLAAGCLATLAGQGRAGVADEVLTAMQFDSEVEEIPWRGGPLFLPSLSWTKPEAKELVRRLITWHVYCDRNDLRDQQRQIHNNLNSWSFANTLGFEMPGGDGLDARVWLRIWRQIGAGVDLGESRLNDRSM